MKKKHLFLTASAALLLAACGNDLTNDPVESGATNDPVTSETETPVAGGDLELADSINIAYAQNNAHTITYNQSTPIEMPDGSTVTQGDLKPVWQYMSDELGVKFNDVALQDSTGEEYIELQATTGFTEANIYSGSMNSAFVRYGQEGYFVDLSDRLADMPNVNAFLNENETILNSITAPDGGVYYLPYVQELGYHAMVFFGRENWVTTLLDTTEGHEAETETISVAYDGYWENRHDSNPVKLQNEAANGGELDQATALQTLVDYIDATYPDLENRSDLFLGADAQYDMDELVAFWRVIKTSPNTLSKVATGEVVEGAITTPMFFRSSGANHTNYLLRLANYFGGQIIYGVDGFSSFYLNEDGELTYSLNEPGALEAFDNLRDIFAEGLLYEEMANESNDDNFRNLLYGSDEDPNNKQFGFMTLDWIASTSTANDQAVAMLPPVTTFGSDDEEFVHFIGGSRPLNTFGAAISEASTEEEVNASLALFDYLFSEEGANVYNFGTPEMWSLDDPFVGPDNVEYPRIGDWAFEQAEQYSSGNLMTFYKEFLGATLQTAYPKSIGTEYQFTADSGLEAWDLYQNNPILQPSYDTDNPLLTITPSVWPINEQQQARLDNTNIGNDQRDQIKLYIMNSSAGPSSTEEIEALFEAGNFDTYLDVYTDLYSTMQ